MTGNEKTIDKWKNGTPPPKNDLSKYNSSNFILTTLNLKVKGNVVWNKEKKKYQFNVLAATANDIELEIDIKGYLLSQLEFNSIRNLIIGHTNISLIEFPGEQTAEIIPFPQSK